MRLRHLSACLLLFVAGLCFSPLLSRSTLINNEAERHHSEGKGENVLLVADNIDLTKLSAPNTRYIIRYKHDLNKKKWSIPSNSVIEFKGGSIVNGAIRGNNTVVSAGLNVIFGLDLLIDGTWTIEKIYPEWFGARGDGQTDDTYAIEACLKLSLLSHGSTYLSSRTYIVTPNKKVAWNVHDNVKSMEAAFIMKSNLTVCYFKSKR